MRLCTKYLTCAYTHNIIKFSKEVIMKILLDMLIIEYMIENKLSVNKFCKKCGVSQDTFYMILNDRGHFDLVELMKIVETLNLKSKTF